MSDYKHKQKNCDDDYISVMFKLIRFSIDKAEVFSFEKTDVLTLEKIYALSEAHSITPIIAYALSKIDYSFKTEQEKAIFNKFNKSLLKSVVKYENTNLFIESVKKTFNEQKIPFIFLKGWVIKDLYPEKYLRTFCDIDVLIKSESFEQNAKIVAKELNLKIKDRTLHDIMFSSPNNDVLELHHTLLEKGRIKSAEKVLCDVWSKATVSDNYQYELPFEYELFYHVAHMAKHVLDGGCGIRPFVDFFVMQQRQYDKEKFLNLIKKSDLDKFYERVVSLCAVWFGDKAADETDKVFEKYIIIAGTYGSDENYATVSKIKKKNGFKYFLSRVFLPYDELKQRYPYLNGKKFLLPFYQVRRWFSSLFKGHAKRRIKELKLTQNVNEERQNKTEKLFKKLGL